MDTDRPVPLRLQATAVQHIDFGVPPGGFSGPVQLWLACHQRLVGVCTLLQQLTEHLSEFGNDDASRLSAAGIRRYFNGAAARHQADEDIDLFPCLIDGLRGRRKAVARSLVERLGDEHNAAKRLWQGLDGQFDAVQRGDKERPDAAAVRAFVATNLSHREAEETSLLDLLNAALPVPQLARLGESMAARRGLTWQQLNVGLL
jgi:hemerythrin-like domain-containing protein